MKLFLDVSRIQFTITRGVEEKVDEHGRQKTNRRDNAPLWTFQVLALEASGGEVINVTVAGEAPKVDVGQAVILSELEAIPWSQGTRSGVAFRAVSVKPATTGRQSASNAA